MTGPHRPSVEPSADAEATEQFAAVPTEQFAAVAPEPEPVAADRPKRLTRSEQFAAERPERSERFAAEPSEPSEPPEQFAEEPPDEPRRVLLLAVVALLGWALDLATKVIAVDELEGRPPVTVIEDVLYVQLVRNAGAAFALATGMTWLLTLIALGVVVAIFRVAGRLRSTGWAVALGLVLAGALGNLTDRLFRSPGPLVGRVVDFISVLEPDGLAWPVFNVADSAICTGGALLVLLAMLGRELDGTRSRDHREHEDG